MMSCIFPSKYFSVAPLLLELSVECTWPIDQVTSFSLILFSSSIQGAAMMALEHILYWPLSEVDMKKQTCSEKDDTAHEQAKDYLPYSVCVTVYGMAFIALYVIFFNPEMKRSKADKSVLPCDEVGDQTVSTTTNVSNISLNIHKLQFI